MSVQSINATMLGALCAVACSCAADSAIASEARRNDTEVGTADAPSEEIVVTATRRSTTLLDTPISVTPIGQQDIERQALSTQSDYLRAVPSVSLVDDGPGQNNLIIRGAYGDAFNTGPTVGVYMGDMPLTGYAIGGSADVILADIERVEVLRGPQGTLFGSNSLSGTVRYIPRAPDLQTFEGSVEAEYSRTGRYGGNNTMVQGIVNLPIADDTFAVRLLAYRQENEGYVRNIAGNEPGLQAAATRFGAQGLAVSEDHVGSNTYIGGRVSALWKPVEDLNITLTYLKQDVTQDERPFEQRQFGAYTRSSYAVSDIIGSEDGLRIDLSMINLTAEYDFGVGTLLSSTSSIDQRYLRKWDIGSLFPNSPPVPQSSITNAEVFVEEVRWTSAFAGPFQVVAGLYYEDSEQPTAQPTYYGGTPSANPFSPTQIFLWTNEFDRLVTQKAAFGELSYAVTDKIKTVLGGRYFKYDATYWSRRTAGAVGANTFSTAEADESGSTLKALVQYEPTESATVYASWSEGFRLGRPLATELIASRCDLNSDGFLDNTSIPSSLDLVSSDSLQSYELGGKLSINRRMSMNVSVYHNDWSDIPVVVQPPGCLVSTTINGGKASARGAELESTVEVFEGFRATVGIGYVDSKLTATTSAGRKNDRMNFTPEFNGSLGLEYEFDLVGRESFVRADYTYFGSYYTQTGERGERADAYGVVNLGLGARVSSVADVQLNIKNLLNDDAVLTLVGFPAQYGTRLRPRTVGLHLGYRF